MPARRIRCEFIRIMGWIVGACLLVASGATAQPPTNLVTAFRSMDKGVYLQIDFTLREIPKQAELYLALRFAPRTV